LFEHDTRAWKDAIYSQFARIGKALSSPKRLEILELLSHGPKTVETLARETEASVANVSQHLQVLLQARMVRFEKAVFAKIVAFHHICGVRFVHRFPYLKYIITFYGILTPYLHRHAKIVVIIVCRLWKSNTIE
jgi:DNA-binding transcriptional ArsR family regulator